MNCGTRELAIAVCDAKVSLWDVEDEMSLLHLQKKQLKHQQSECQSRLKLALKVSMDVCRTVDWIRSVDKHRKERVKQTELWIEQREREMSINMIKKESFEEVECAIG